jgi:hypothetical protein
MTKLSNLGLLTLIASSALACTVDRTQTVTNGYFFTGWVYDGVSNERLGDGDDDGYSLYLTYGKKTLPQASVDDTSGRFWIGPVEPFHDYTISIDAGQNYRPFYASEEFLAGAARGPKGLESHIFEAFIFQSPDLLPSPELTFTIQTPDGTQPDGQIRVTPNNDVGESVLNLQGDIDGSVDGQVWENDADRKFETVVLPVEGGVVTFGEGALVYGVEYEATVYAAAGYALQSFTFRSGVTDDQTVVLARLTEQALAITADSREYDDDALDENATVVLTFNQPIELSASFDALSVDEAVDDGFDIVSADFDGDTEQNVLIRFDPGVTDEEDVQENGAHFAIDGNTLTLSWDRDDGANFFTIDGDDPITFATYDISTIRLKPVGGRADQEVQLSTLLGGNNVGLQVDQIIF